MARTNTDVLIAGAGPVGLFAALSLTKRGVPVQVADRGWRAGTHSYALALHARSLKHFRDIGLLESVLERSHVVRRIGLYDAADRKVELAVEPAATSWSFLAVLRQDVLEDLLVDELKKAGVPVLWSHEVFGLEQRPEGVTARVDKFEKDSVGYAVARTEWVLAKSIDMDVRYVIGADGNRSRVRRVLRLDYPEVAPAQYYAVFEFESDASLQDELRVVLGPQTSDVLWPLPGGYCRWSFELPGYLAEAGREKDRLYGSGASEFPVLTEDNLRTLIAERAPWFSGRIGEITWRNVVRFEKRLASGYGAGRMWLAGDAAHLAGPVGVQSMNAGLSEAHDLAEIIAGGGPEQGFQEYQSYWTGEWKRMLGVTGGLQGRGVGDAWISGKARRLHECLPAFGDDLVRLADQIRLDFEAASGVAG